MMPAPTIIIVMMMVLLLSFMAMSMMRPTVRSEFLTVTGDGVVARLSRPPAGWHPFTLRDYRFPV